MYHCHIDFYCAGHRRDLFETLEKMAPMESFSHTFTITEEPEAGLASQADVILADLRGMDARAVLQTLASHKKPEADLILLAEQGQLAGADLAPASDIWPAPLSEDELRFHFIRWQQGRKTRADLWQANQYLDATINISPNLVWFKTKDGLHEKVNDSFCRTVGKTKEQVRNRGHAYIWDVEEDDPACLASDHDVIESKCTHISEERVHTGGGERILTTYKSPLYDLDGSVMGTVGVALDITQERSYEEELLQKSSSMERLFTTMDCGVLYHAADSSHVISVNRAALNILGYGSKEEMEADGFHVVAASVMDEDKPLLRQAIQSIQRPNESTTVEYRVLHKDGTVLHVIGNIKLMEENGVQFYQRFLLDCTAQKLREQAEQSRMDQKIKYQEQLFNIFSTYLAYNTDDVYMMLNAGGDQVEYVSPNVERVLGISLNDSRDIRQFGQAKYAGGEAVTWDDLHAMRPGESLDARETERVNSITGEHKWFRESVYCVSLQNEKKIVVYISDRTKERKTQDNLAEALGMAQVANKAKSAFLSSISHDIRTPMNAIMGFITLLREDARNPDRVLEYTQRIDAASQHLLGLINDVLDLNKIESGSATLNLTEFNLAGLIDEINAIIRPQAKAKDQTFDIHTSALTYEHLIGDPLRINQILINILSNAVKYTQKGGHIWVTVTELPQIVENYSRIQFVVSDNGQGMSDAYQKVIFSPFTREQETVTSQIQGTGLGMSITKSLVDLMGGSIKVDSKIGKGSTFTVELELRIQEREDDPKFWDEHNVARMIVVDDDEMVCASIIHSMSQTGVKVDYAMEGGAAVDMICRAQESGAPYDLVLLDWKMPGLNGIETARLIRERHAPKVPILIFTAYDWDEIEDEALEVGISHFLPKPFFMSNFKELIRRVMGGQPKQSAAHDNAVKGRHVLVVDDIEVNRIIMVKILTSLGAVCDTAENGQEAVDKFEASAPGAYDIIMMDIQMPIMDGYTAARAIRASSHPSAQDVAVVAMTANAFVDDVRDALLAGMDAHIAKPIVVNTMMATIREVMDSKGK